MKKQLYVLFLFVLMNKLYTTFFMFCVVTVSLSTFANENKKNRCCSLMKGIGHFSKWVIGTSMQTGGAVLLFSASNLSNVPDHRVDPGGKFNNRNSRIFGGTCLFGTSICCIYGGTKCKKNDPLLKAKENFKEALCGSNYEMTIEEMQ